MTAQERNKLRCAERQLYIVLGMCEVRRITDAASKSRRMNKRQRAAADGILWRELFVLLGMCGCGW